MKYILGKPKSPFPYGLEFTPGHEKPFIVWYGPNQGTHQGEGWARRTGEELLASWKDHIIKADCQWLIPTLENCKDEINFTEKILQAYEAHWGVAPKQSS